MNKNELFIKILQTKMLQKLSFIRGVLSLPIDNQYVTIIKGGYSIEVDGEIVDIMCDNKLPLFEINDTLTLPKGSMRIVNEDIDTTYGRAIINYLLLEVGLDGYVEYMNRMFTYKEVRDSIIVPAVNSGDLPLSVYKKCVNVDVFCRSLSDMVVIAVSENMIFPPEGLEKFKKSILNKFNKEYGKSWKNDKKIVIQYEDTIMGYYKDHMKDDPTLDITLDKKMFKSIQSRNVAIGILDSLDTGSDSEAIISSLAEGMPKDPDALASVFNSVIYGSSARGSLTAVGGVISKTLTRATHNYKISEDDCGVNYGATVLVDENIKGRTLVDGTVITKSNVTSYIGKYVEMRSIVYCKTKGENFCKVCAGESMSKLEGSVLLIALGIGGSVLKHYLSMFHSTTRNVLKIKKDSLF